jgi:hypothetical protein
MSAIEHLRDLVLHDRRFRQEGGGGAGPSQMNEIDIAASRRAFEG